MKNILKVLCLYKQHYLNDYNNKKTAAYSCLGYYDCMEILDVNDFHKNRIMMGKGNRNLADMWYQLGGQTASQNGKYLQQNIGLFCYDDLPKWDNFEKANEVFLCACMIQVKEEQRKQYKKVEDAIEGLSFNLKSDETLNSILFRTLDNEDYVLLIKSNSYKCIVHYVEIVSEIEDIEYTHSICGISEVYLQCLEKVGYDFDTVEWLGSQLKDDLIAEVVMKIVLNSGVNVNEMLRSLPIDGEWSYVLGHPDVITSSKNIKMSKVIGLLKKNLGVDHSNPLYGKDILNIETILKIEKNSFTVSMPFDFDKSQSKTSEISKWCELKIKQLRENYKMIREMGDETFMAFYEAMIQSLNMLAPYEGSKFSRDIFYMIFPAIRLFYHQLDQIMLEDKGNNGDYEIKLGRLKERDKEILIHSITQFMDAVDPIIYRAVHGEQNFLTVPGYGGVIFAIPAKLMLMYMAYAWKVINVLNDSDEHKYVCCIKPMVNAKIRTVVIDFTMDPSKRLIQIETSHRILYMPRAMLMMLGHEISHFSGDETRIRKKRLEYMIKALAYIGAEAVFDIENHRDALSLFERNKENVRHHMVDYLYGEMEKKLGESKAETKYHFQNVNKCLKEICTQMFIDENCYLEFELYKIKDANNKEIQGYGFESIFRAVKSINDNISIIQTEGYMQDCIDLLECMFKEPYADIAMMLIQEGKTWEYYFENFFIAEGRTELKIDIVYLNRWASVVETVCRLSKTMRDQWKKLVRDKKKQKKEGRPDTIVSLVVETDKFRNACNRKKDYFFKQGNNNTIEIGNNNRVGKFFQAEKLLNFSVIWEYQKKYLYDIGYRIKKRLENDDNVLKLREFFSAFLCYEEGDDYPYNKWFEQLDIIIADYIGEVDVLLENEKNNSR